jgi:hypothetical protein
VLMHLKGRVIVVAVIEFGLELEILPCLALLLVGKSCTEPKIYTVTKYIFESYASYNLVDNGPRVHYAGAP